MQAPIWAGVPDIFKFCQFISSGSEDQSGYWVYWELECDHNMEGKFLLWKFSILNMSWQCINTLDLRFSCLLSDNHYLISIKYHLYQRGAFWDWKFCGFLTSGKCIFSFADKDIWCYKMSMINPFRVYSLIGSH